MRPRVRRSVAAALVLLVLAGWSAGSGASPSAAPSATPDRRSPDGSVLPSPSSDVTVPGELLTALIADATARSGVPPAAISVISGESVTWNDGSWGCPKPGVMYTQALVDGYQVVLDAGGQRIDYREVDPTHFRVCEGLLGG